MTRLHLDMVLLRTFVAAADHGSLAGAASDVFRTQAAVSQQMQRLETIVGCELFARTGRRKQLTEQGLRLLDFARQILRLNDDACKMLTVPTLDQSVRFGACADAIDSLLPEYLALSAKTHPGVRIEIVPSRTQWMTSALRRGAIDMFVDVVDLDEFPRHTLRTSPMVWIAGARFQHQANVALPLILGDAPCVFRQSALSRLDESGIPWRIAYTSTTLVGVRAALRAGLGVTPRSVEMLLPDLKVVGEDFGLPRLPNVSFHLYHREEHGSASSAGVVDLFTSH